MGEPRETGSTGPVALRMSPSDNVAVAVRDLDAGDEVVIGEYRLVLAQPIAFGHKVALEDIPEGQPVRKYAEVIGIASRQIASGTHVHVHNVVSARLPGPGEQN